MRGGWGASTPAATGPKFPTTQGRSALPAPSAAAAQPRAAAPIKGGACETVSVESGFAAERLIERDGRTLSVFGVCFGVRLVLANAGDQNPQVAEKFHARYRLPGTQHRANHRLGLDVAEVQRLVAVSIVELVEKAQLLPAVGLMEAVVEVDGDGFGSLPIDIPWVLHNYHDHIKYFVTSKLHKARSEYKDESPVENWIRYYTMGTQIPNDLSQNGEHCGHPQLLAVKKI